MALPQWSRRSLVLVGLMLAIGGFLIGSSSSQEDNRGPEREVGRYQMIAPQPNYLYVFDTKTARYWKYEGKGNWSNHLGPVAPPAKAADPNPDGKPEAN